MLNEEIEIKMLVEVSATINVQSQEHTDEFLFTPEYWSVSRQEILDAIENNKDELNELAEKHFASAREAWELERALGEQE